MPGKCPCSKPMPCSSFTKLFAEKEDELWIGHIHIRNRPSPKIQIYRKLVAKELGVHNIDTHFHICKHHFSRPVLQWCLTNNKNLTTPITKTIAQNNSLMDYVASAGYSSAGITKLYSMLYFIPNNPFATVDEFFQEIMI